MNEIRRRLLAAMLAQVPFDGWGGRALRGAAGDADMEWITARRAFPRGADDVLAFWSADVDRRMLEALEALDLHSMRVRERIATAVRVRLGLYREHREALRLALACAALPGHAPRAMRALYRTVDAMWHAAGDTATDFNFYTKRILLAAVYTSTMLYWLEDKSEDCAATWAFLDRRVADVMRVAKAMSRLQGFVPDLARLRRGARPRRAANG